MPSFSGANDVRFTLNGTTYQNNSVVTLEDIGEGDDALLCITDSTVCCARDQSPGRAVLGEWYYPNGTRVANSVVAPGPPQLLWEFYRNRGPSVVRMNRRRGGENGIYGCVIPDTEAVNQYVYIGVYTASSGEWYMYNLFC